MGRCKSLDVRLKQRINSHPRHGVRMASLLADKAREFFGDDSDAKDGDKENE